MIGAALVVWGADNVLFLFFMSLRRKFKNSRRKQQQQQQQDLIASVENSTKVYSTSRGYLRYYYLIYDEDCSSVVLRSSLA